MWLVHGQPIGLMAPTFEHGMAFIHPDDRDRVQLAIQEALAGKGEYETEYRTTFPDGSVHWIGARGRAVFDNAGRPERMIGVAMDITGNKLAEDALRRSEKLAAAGRLAATIAHEINNPLEAVTNLLFILRVNDKWDDNARGYVAQAEHELARIAHVTRQTLGFYRDTTSPHLMDLPKIVEDVLSLYLPRIQAKNIRLSREYDKTVQITGLPGEIRQVVSNLVANAIDALPAQGALRIRVHHARELTNSNRPGGRIVIADTGSGIRRHIVKNFLSLSTPPSRMLAQGWAFGSHGKSSRNTAATLLCAAALPPTIAGQCFLSFCRSESASMNILGEVRPYSRFWLRFTPLHSFFHRSFSVRRRFGSACAARARNSRCSFR